MSKFHFIISYNINRNKPKANRFTYYSNANSANNYNN